MNAHPSIKLKCPDCSAELSVNLTLKPEDQCRRKCRKCGQRWSILTKPVAGFEFESRFFRLPAQTEYHLNGIAGLVQQTRSKVTGTLVGVYNCSQAGLDDDGGESPWATICEAHNNVCTHRTLQAARSHAVYPSWCEACHKIIDREAHQGNNP